MNPGRLPDNLRAITLLHVAAIPFIGGCYLGERYVEGPPRARVTTSLGEFVIELFPQVAPVTVENFQQYARDGFYEGTIFHRVVEGFVIQGGGFTADLEHKPTRPPISLESRGLRNSRGSVAMARTADANSATSQFFVNLADNGALDATLEQPGYAVFGFVADGMEVVDAIGSVSTQSSGGFEDVPVDPILITSITIEPGESMLSPDWEAYGDAVELNFQRYLMSTAIDIFNLLIRR